MGIRIYKDRHYVREVVPGISGFQRWNERERTIVTGYKASNCRCDIVAEYSAWSGRYQLHDGHLPEYRPVVDADAAKAWLLQSRYAEVSEVR